MAQLQLRPHSVGDIIDASFTVYRKRFGPMIAIGLLLVFIPFVVSVIGGCTIEGAATACDSAIGWIGSIASQIGTAVASAGAVLVAAEAYAGMPSDWRQSAAAGLRRIIPIVVLRRGHDRPHRDRLLCSYWFRESSWRPRSRWPRPPS